MATSRVEAFSLTHAQILDGTETFLEAALATATDEALDIYGVSDASLSPNKDEYKNEGDDVVKSIWSWLEDADVTVQAGFLSLPLLESILGRSIETSGDEAAVNEVQSLTITASGGNYTLTVGGQTTGSLLYSANAATVEAALLALSTVDTGDITVGTSGSNRTLTYGGDYAGQNVPLITVNDVDLTGGTVVASTTTPGSAATSDSFEFDLWHEDDLNVAPKPMILKMPSKDEDGVVRTLTIGLYKVQFDPITFEGPKYKDGLKVNYDGKALYSLKDEKGVAFPDGKQRVGRILSHG